MKYQAYFALIGTTYADYRDDCIRQCGTNAWACQLNCWGAEEETNTQRLPEVCEKACGPYRNDCNTSCIPCVSDCGNDAKCRLNCGTIKEETYYEKKYCENVCFKPGASWKIFSKDPCVDTCKSKKAGCSTQCGKSDDKNKDKCMLNCVTSEEEINTQKSACGIDERKNKRGPQGCWNQGECNGQRTCSSDGWCIGNSGCDVFDVCGIDEAKNKLGPYKCDNSAECKGARTCSSNGWCQGSNDCGCGKDEAKNRLGPSKCNNSAECKGTRTCSSNGWCHGSSGCGCGIDEANGKRGPQTCDNSAECKGDRTCSKRGWCQGSSNCDAKEEEETNTQLGVCRNVCGTENIWSPCVIGCKIKQVKCARKCDRDLNCMVDCVTDEPEEETNTLLRVCRNACGTNNVLNPCVIGCKIKQVKCARKCDRDLHCIVDCVTDEPEEEEETNTPVGVCGTICGDNSWSPCVIRCKGKQAKCFTQCGTDVNCGTNCLKFAPEAEEEATEMLDVSMSRWGERDDMEMMRDLNYLAMEVTGRSVDDFKKLMGDLTGVEDFVM